MNVFSFYTFLKTQLHHCQTQAYDCGRGKTRLGGATPKIGGAIAPPLPHAGYGTELNNEFSKKVNGSAAQAKVSVCHVHAPPIPPDTVAPGTADLYEMAEGVFTVATNNHVIPITDTNFLVNTVFTFEGPGQIKLSKKDINFCTTNKELDATVIELTEAGVKRLQKFGA